VYLQKAIYPAASLSGFAIHCFKQSMAIDPVDHVNERSDETNFVALQVTNKMPADIGREFSLLAYKLLDVVFPEIPLPKVIERLNVR
jgi:hypothetical protein